MDTWNYLAFGTIERLAIIAAAMVIGYWGYRIFAQSQRAGLSLIIAAAVVLLGALLTAERHLQSVSDGLIASAPPASPTGPAATGPAPPGPATVAAPAAADPDPAPTAPADEPAPERAALAATDAAPREAATGGSGGEERVPRLMPLASGQELGGRITSIRSENVTLEWSPEVQRRRVISASPGATRAP